MNLFTILITLCLCAFVSGNSIGSKIQMGHSAADGKFPYTVSIRRDSGVHFCGGTIFNKRTIITAAQCNFGLSQKVLVGSTTLNGTGIVHYVEKIIPHPEYNKQTSENDIALLILSNDIEFNYVAQPLPIATRDIGPLSTVVAMGWGDTEGWGLYKLANRLQWAELKTITFEECEQKHKGYIFDSQICTLTKPGQGICTGDYGSPLVFEGELVGIISDIYECGGSYPDLYTRVYYFKSWIEENAAKVN